MATTTAPEAYAADDAETRTQWQEVLRELERDGRATARDVAERIGTSEAHARRVVRRLLGNGWIQQRIDARPGKLDGLAAAKKRVTDFRDANCAS